MVVVVLGMVVDRMMALEQRVVGVAVRMLLQ